MNLYLFNYNLHQYGISQNLGGAALDKMHIVPSGLFGLAASLLLAHTGCKRTVQALIPFIDILHIIVR